MNVASLNSAVTPATVKAANADFFASDLSITKEGLSEVIVTISVDTAVAIEVTLDGTNYDTINSGQALVADSIYAFSFILLKADAFNIRTPTTGGCTVNICRVQELPVEYS